MLPVINSINDVSDTAYWPTSGLILRWKQQQSPFVGHQVRSAAIYMNKSHMRRGRLEGHATPGNGVPIVIRAAQQTPITDEESTTKSAHVVSHLSNDLCSRAELRSILFGMSILYLYRS
jgi:hypothetical protein